MGIMEAKLEKELNNKVNRRCNCDDANLSKVVEAAMEQIAAIQILREKGVFDKLPAKLQQAAVAMQRWTHASIWLRSNRDTYIKNKRWRVPPLILYISLSPIRNQTPFGDFPKG